VNKRHHRRIATAASVVAISVTATAWASPDLRIGFSGYGAARWGDTVARTAHALHVTFDCSRGAVPGTCLCPESRLSATPVFWGRPARLQAVFSSQRGSLTTRGVGPGSPLTAVRRAYPTGHLVRNGPLTSGTSTYYLDRHAGHALVFELAGRAVREVIAFRDGSTHGISQELCA